MASAVAPTETHEETLPKVIPAPAETVALVVDRNAKLNERVGALVIRDQADLAVASTLLSDIRALRKEVATAFGEPKATAHRLWKQLCDRLNQHDGPLVKLETRVKGAMGEFTAREEARLRQEAAEREAAQRKQDEEAQLAEAAALEEAGDTEAAEAVLNEKPPPPPPPAATKVAVKGAAFTTRWSATVTDIKQLIEAAHNKDPMAVSIFADEKVIAAVTTRASAMARSLKEQLKVPGVQVHAEKSVSGR